MLNTIRTAELGPAIVEGVARFTVITPICLRMEYAPKEGFVDEPTLFAMRRASPDVMGTVIRSDGELRVETDRLRLVYRPDGRPFHSGNLAVSFLHGNRRIEWTPGMTAERNLGGPLATLDGIGKSVPLSNGLLSRDGWHVVDDSGAPIMAEGWIRQRPGGLPVARGLKVDQDLDWYFFGYGLDFRAALQGLQRLGGRVPMPRRQVLGSWYCRWHRYSSDDFRQIVREYREHDFPLDILVMDMDWHTQREARSGLGHAYTLGWTGYTWDRSLLPDSEDLLRELRDDGIRVTLNDHPADGIREHEACYPDFMRRLGSGSDRGDNPPFDAGDRTYMQAFFEASHAPLERTGVDFWWVDWQQDHLMPYVRGVPGLQHLPWLNHLYYAYSEKDGRRGQGFSRWGGWGDHRYPIQFSGDAVANWEMLAFEIPFTLASGNAGCFFWAHDIGGFSGERDPEMYTRWVQFGALSAALRLHSCGEELDRRPWLWGEPYASAMKKAFHFRSELFPYLYSSVRQSYDEMIPLLRPLYLEYPEIEAAYQSDTQYLFGEALLAAPIVTPGTGPRKTAMRSVWFPPGVWYHFFTGERIEGGQTRGVSAALDEIPLYVRAGVPLPLQPYTPRMAGTPLTTLRVRCFPGENGRFRLYEDDGDSTDYERGGCAWTELRSERHGDRTYLTIEAAQGSYRGQPEKRTVEVELPGLENATAATINGAPAVWSYDSRRCMNRLRIPETDIRCRMEVEIQAVETHPADRRNESSRQ